MIDLHAARDDAVDWGKAVAGRCEMVCLSFVRVMDKKEKLASAGKGGLHVALIVWHGWGVVTAEARFCDGFIAGVENLVEEDADIF